MIASTLLMLVMLKMLIEMQPWSHPQCTLHLLKLLTLHVNNEHFNCANWLLCERPPAGMSSHRRFVRLLYVLDQVFLDDACEITAAIMNRVDPYRMSN